MTEVLDYLDDIIDAARKIRQYTDGMEYEEFSSDERTADAVLRNFQVIGEATKEIPDDFYREYDDVPWSEMAGMRDMLVHGYATIDLRIVWATAQGEIPVVLSRVRAIRDELETD